MHELNGLGAYNVISKMFPAGMVFIYPSLFQAFPVFLAL